MCRGLDQGFSVRKKASSLMWNISCAEVQTRTNAEKQIQCLGENIERPRGGTRLHEVSRSRFGNKHGI